jgi:hypothetical protein
VAKKCSHRLCAATRRLLKELEMATIVMPDESAYGGRDPWFDRLTTLSKIEGESSEIQYNQILSGSRLAPRVAGLGRDDEFRHGLLREEGTCSYPAELNT